LQVQLGLEEQQEQPYDPNIAALAYFLIPRNKYRAFTSSEGMN
jgi:hypothetical protein